MGRVTSGRCPNGLDPLSRRDQPSDTGTSQSGAVVRHRRGPYALASGRPQGRCRADDWVVAEVTAIGLMALAVSLGGRAAEELAFGQPTTGAESDLKAATDLARRMVGQWGMSEELGPVSYNIGEHDPFLGRQIAAPKEYAETTAARIDKAVAELLEGARERARAVLADNRDVLDALAEELVAKETVSGVRLAEIAAAVRDAARLAAAGPDARNGTDGVAVPAS